MNLKPKNISIICILIFSWSTIIFSQNSKDSKLKIQGANQLFIEKKYVVAKDLWLEIAKENPNNSNINYKTGVCLIEAPGSKAESLAYLKTASLKVNKNYSPFDNSIQTAPVEVYFYLGRSYLYNNFQDSAIKYLNKFLSISSKKHYLKSETEKIIQQCRNYFTVNKNHNEHHLLQFTSVFNSEFNELNPLISLNGSSIIFTSDRERNLLETSNKKIFDVETGNHFLDLYIAEKDFKNKKWTNPKILKISKTRSNEIGMGFSSDLNKIIFSNGQTSSKKLNNNSIIEKSKNYTSSKDFQHFPDFNISSVMITENEKFMYFSSDKSGGYGGKDIWFSKKLPDNTWSKPTNMGPNINSSSDETSPFLHPDGVTFFYSSNSDKSIGGYDVFISKKQSDNSWGESLNIGIPINTVFDEKFFSTSTDGTLGYYSSIKKDGNSDLISVKIDTPYSEPLIYITGYIDKLEKESLDDIIIKLINNDLESDPLIYKPNNFNGSYIFKAEKCYNYDIDYYKLVTLSSGKVKESLMYEQSIKTPCENTKTIISPINLPTVDYYGNVVEKKQEINTIIEEVKEKNKKYNFKEIISKDNNLIALLLIDENGNIVDKAILTPDGFKFELLNSNDNYTFKLENFPDSLDLSDIPIILLEGKKYTEVRGDFKENNTFKYQQKSSAYKEIKEKNKKYNFKEIISKDNNLIALLLIDENGNIVDKAILTPDGFKFELLNSNDNYTFKIENFPDSLDLSDIPIFLFEQGKETLIHGDFKNGNLYKYVNTFNSFKFKEIISSYGESMKLFLIDEDGNVIEKGILTNNGFKFELISSQLEYSFKIENFPDNLDLSEIPILIKNHEEELIIVGDFTKNNQYQLPKIHFKKSFQLGEYSIENDIYFKKFMKKVIDKINASGKVKLEIVGSSSKIPTKRYSSNTALAKLRVEKGKKYIYDYLDNKNISRELVQIVKERAIVSGPEFNSNDKDQSKYFKYQYFSIWAE